MLVLLCTIVLYTSSWSYNIPLPLKVFVCCGNDITIKLKQMPKVIHLLNECSHSQELQHSSSASPHASPHIFHFFLENCVVSD